MNNLVARVCRMRGTSALAVGCEHFIPGLSESRGITASDICTGHHKEECRYKKEIEPPVLCEWNGLDVVAGWRESRLIKLSPDSMVDVLPSITAHEFGILHSWAKDYIHREIPWLVTRIGVCFVMWKRKRV